MSQVATLTPLSFPTCSPVSVGYYVFCGQRIPAAFLKLASFFAQVFICLICSYSDFACPRSAGLNTPRWSDTRQGVIPMH